MRNLIVCGPATGILLGIEVIYAMNGIIYSIVKQLI